MIRIRVVKNGGRTRSGVRLLIALLVVALTVVGCGSNSTDERSVEGGSGDGAPDAGEQPEPESAPESPVAEDEVTEEASDAGGTEEAAADTPRPSLPIGPDVAGADADDSPPVVLDDRIIAADLWGPELAILSAGMGSTG